MRLRKEYPSRPNAELAEEFECDEREIERRAEELALRKNKRVFTGGKMPRWSDEEIAYLREHYEGTASIDIALHLGRSERSIVSKAHHLGLRKGRDRLAEMGRENVGRRYRGRRNAPRHRGSPPEEGSAPAGG